MESTVMDDFRATAKLPVFSIFFRALLLPATHFRLLLIYSTPVVLCTVIAYFVRRVIQPPDISDTAFIAALMVLLILNLSLPLVMISFHRIFLLPKKTASQVKVFRWTMTEMRFVFWWVLIGIAVVIVMVPYTIYMLPLLVKVWPPAEGSLYILWLQKNCIYIPFMYLSARFILMFPAIAINAGSCSPVMAWRLSKGNGWRLMVLIWLLPMVTERLEIALLDFTGPVAEVLKSSVWGMCGVIEVGLLSLSFAWLRDNCSPEKEQTAVDVQEQT